MTKKPTTVIFKFGVVPSPPIPPKSCCPIGKVINIRRTNNGIHVMIHWK
jgi:hypothetical protein